MVYKMGLPSIFYYVSYHLDCLQQQLQDPKVQLSLNFFKKARPCHLFFFYNYRMSLVKHNECMCRYRIRGYPKFNN